MTAESYKKMFEKPIVIDAPSGGDKNPENMKSEDNLSENGSKTNIKSSLSGNESKKESAKGEHIKPDPGEKVDPIAEKARKKDE